MTEHKYKYKVFKGASFPDAPIKNNVKISFTKEMINEYLPTIEKVEASKGIKLLCIIMASKEGFYKNTRSYRCNNPGNIGNTDSGNNKQLKTLKDGIELQVSYLNRIINGQSRVYPIGKKVFIKPFYSEEIERNPKTYNNASPYLPGYEFFFGGELEGFVKIYATMARCGNSYLNMIISFFANHGITITEKTTLKEISQIV